MVKPAQGFMSEDGNFFETEAEAEFHEAETHLMNYLGSENMGGAEIDRYMEVCVTHKAKIRRYLNAYEAINQQEATEAAILDAVHTEVERLTADVGGYSQNHTPGATGYTPIQSQSDNGHSDVSDVGSGPHSKTVQDDTSRDGS